MAGMVNLNPRTGLPYPYDTDPDEVDASALETRPAVSRASMTDFPPEVDPVTLQRRDMPAPPPPAEPGALPADLALPPPAIAKPTALPTKPARAPGAGGGAPPMPKLGQPTADEAAARGEERLGQLQERAAIGDEADLKAQVAQETHAQNLRDQEALAAHEADVTKRRDEGYKYLQKKQEDAANFRLKDIYEGRPLAALGAALMAGLGQYASGLNGQPNTALGVLDSAAKNFRDREMVRLDQLNKGVADAKDRIEMNRLEATASEAGLWKRLAAERATNLSRFGADQERIQGDKIYAGAVQRQAQAEREWATTLHQRGQQEKMQGMQLRLMQSEINKNNAAASADKTKYNKELDPARLTVTGPDGKALFTARSAEEAEKANAQLASTRDVLAKARELQGLIGEGRTFLGMGDRAAKMEALQADLMNKVRVAEQMGSLDKGAAEILERMIPAGAGFTGSGKVKIDQFIKMAQEGAARKFDAYGVPGEKVVKYLDRSEGGAPAPTRSEYATLMNRLKKATAGTEEYERIREAAVKMKAAMGF